MASPTITPTSIPGVGLQHTARFGTSAVAMRDFSAGSLIMAEVPLLCTAALAVNDQAAVERLTRKVPASKAVQVVAFCQAGAEVQRQVLECMYSPEPAEVAGTAMLGICSKVAAAVAQDAQLVQALGAASASEAEATALKVMLAWQSSAWQFQRDKSTLFEIGHKIAHMCGTPNTVYRSCGIDDLSMPEEVRGKGCRVARRDIAAGELLSVGYVRPKLIVQSAPARRHLLRQSFGFVCECDHCCRSGVDRYRGLPCPVCSADVRDSNGAIEIQVAMGRVPPKGVVWCDLGKVAAGDPAPWACDSCGAGLPDDDRLLYGPWADQMRRRGEPDDNIEVKLLKLIQVWDQAVEAGQVTIKDMTTKWAMVLKAVGPAHWAAYHMYGLHAVVHTGELARYALDDGAAGQRLVQTKGVSEVVDRFKWHLDELKDDYDKIWEWMSRTTTPEEAAETASPHFLATARQLLDATETNLLPVGSASGSSRQPVLEVQHQLARLTGVLLRRIGPALERTRGWYLPHVLLHDWDVLMQRCERVLALPVMTLEEAISLVQESQTDRAHPGFEQFVNMMEQIELAAGQPQAGGRAGQPAAQAGRTGQPVQPGQAGQAGQARAAAPAGPARRSGQAQGPSKQPPAG